MITRAITIQTFLEWKKGRERWLLALAILLSLVLGVTYTAFQLDSPLVPVIFLLSIAVPVILWTRPTALVYIVFAAACLFELYPSDYPDALTERVPFFWNVNTIFQIYAHVNFKALPVNIVEILLITAGAGSLVQAVFNKTFRLRFGPMALPIGLYVAFVLWGWVNGIATGGDFKISLQEVRAQLYFAAAYFIAVHLIRDPKQLRSLWWVMAICIGLKGLLYTYRRYVTIGGQPLPDQGVGSHEEALLFVLLAFFLVVLYIATDVESRALRTFLWLSMPVVFLGNLATNRRAGTAAAIIALPMMLFAAYQSFPRCRRAISIGATLLILFGPVYYVAFKNSDAPYAQPARAIRSNFEPDQRDANSNAYRDAENQDQMATIRLAPIQGYGYGKRMLHAVPIADISSIYEWWDILPHNQILWIWMRTGTFGFIAFWIMVCALIIQCCQVARDTEMPQELRLHALFCLAAFVGLLIFGLLDLQLSNFRSMLFVAILLGSLGGVHGQLARPAVTPGPLPALPSRGGTR